MPHSHKIAAGEAAALLLREDENIKNVLKKNKTGNGHSCVLISSGELLMNKSFDLKRI